MNAINKKTFTELFPDVELEESTQILQNFDKRLIKPIGSFRCFLRWKGHKYRVKFEVMGIETPNLLSGETTFLMGILKKCLSVETAPNNQISPPVSGHSVPPTEAAPVPSTEGVILPFSFRPRKQLPLCVHGRCILQFSTAHGNSSTYVHGQISDELCQHSEYGRFLRTLTKTRCRFKTPFTFYYRFASYTG